MRLCALVIVCVVVAWTRSAEACSCGRDSSDLARDLRQSREGAEVIFRARAVTVGPRWPLLALFGAHTGLEATLQVDEVFKGQVAKSVVFAAGDLSGMCDYPFRAGSEYLVYASMWEGKLGTTFCDRTRPVEKNDPELKWLRTGELPPLPRALKRERVDCQSCESEAVARVLTGVSEAESAYGGVEVLQRLLSMKRPVWVKRDEGPVRAHGVAANGKAFELSQTPGYSTWERCRQRVQLRWCERLEASTGDNGEASLRCVGAGPAEEVCDERKTRSSAWGPVESMDAALCSWGAPDSPWCELRAVQLLPKSAVTRPLLVCSPAYGYADKFQCAVETGPTGQ